MTIERVTTGPRDPIPSSASNLSPSSENSDGANRSNDSTRSINPQKGTQGNTPRKFPPDSPSAPTVINGTSPLGNVQLTQKDSESSGLTVTTGPAKSKEPLNSTGPGKDLGPPPTGDAKVDASKLLAGRPVGDQTGMPPGVVPRNRRLTETELSQNPLNTFLQDPSSFAASYFINTMQNFVMPGRTVPAARPGETVNGSDNVVGFTLNRIDGHNAAMTVTGVPSELGRPGTPSSSLAYYLPFTNGGATTIRVPRHPTSADPQFLVTGAFTGCSFYVREDPTDPNSLLFTHDPRRGTGTTTSSSGIPEGAVGISYDATYGQEDGMLPTQVPSASAFAFYNQETRQWVMNVQHAVVEVPLSPSGIPGAPQQRQRRPGQLEGAFIPIVFGNERLPPRTIDPNLPGPSNRNGSSEGMSFWAAFETGGGTGAAIGGAAGAAAGAIGGPLAPGTVPVGAGVGAGLGALAGAAVAGTAWLFNWAQHSDLRP